MVGGPAVDGGMAGLLRDMRGDAGSPEIGDEVGAVVALVGTEGETALRAWRVPLNHRDGGRALCVPVLLRQLGLDDQARAVLHQRVP